MQEVLTYPDHEQREIEEAYQLLLDSIKVEIDDTDRENIHTAYELAVKAHIKQRRKSGEPYILHPIEVARICASEIGLGPTAIISALLHDVVEDTDVTQEEINSRFGEKIGIIVNGLTKLDGLYNVPSPQAENFKKVIKTLLVDIRVVLIKMADRLHNMRTLGSMPPHKQLKIAAETSFIYAPLAHRLGLYNIKTEFQDLCMKVTDAEMYEELSQKLEDSEKDRNDYINKFIRPLRKSLNSMGIDYRVLGRPKSIYSIYNKIKTKKVPFEEIYDLFAVRVIVSVLPKLEKQVCWQVYSMVTDFYKPIPERLKDWVTTPKANGYESLHTTVVGPQGRFVEVQIRTERMDEIAERGFAAHWKYKGVTSQKENVYEKWLDTVRETLESQDGDAIEFVNDFKTSLYNEEVYVYTPKGDLKILPKGATALDFAFSIHSDVGYHCSAIKVNNKLVPMGYELQNGDQIWITTSKNQKPNKSWLKMTVTGKARGKIRAALREERKEQAEFGKEALGRKLKHNKIDFEEGTDFLVNHLKYKNRLDFYYDISMDNIHLASIFKDFKVEGGKLVLIEEETPKTKVEEEAVPLKRKRAETNFKPRLIINGEEGDSYEYTLATCCNPLQGDRVFAYVTAASGMKIHRTNCPNATNLMANYGYRIMKAEWIMMANSSFVADLVITGIDSGPGVIEKMSHTISSRMGLNIRSFHIDGNEGYYEAQISLLVQNKDQLVLAIRDLQNLEGISSVVRVED